MGTDFSVQMSKAGADILKTLAGVIPGKGGSAKYQVVAAEYEVKILEYSNLRKANRIHLLKRYVDF